MLRNVSLMRLRGKKADALEAARTGVKLLGTDLDVAEARRAGLVKGLAERVARLEKP